MSEGTGMKACLLQTGQRYTARRAQEAAESRRNPRTKSWLAGGFGGEAEGFHDGVVDGGTDFGDFVVLAGGVDAICK